MRTATLILILVYGNGQPRIDGPYQTEALCVAAGEAYLARRWTYAEDTVVAFDCGDPEGLFRRGRTGAR